MDSTDSRRWMDDRPLTLLEPTNLSEDDPDINKLRLLYCFKVDLRQGGVGSLHVGATFCLSDRYFVTLKHLCKLHSAEMSSNDGQRLRWTGRCSDQNFGHALFALTHPFYSRLQLASCRGAI